ncbi:MAG: MltA domain-containing protein [Desulfovibrionaceae bacterium]|nr:MltA domain-containing protein [Desulfovibrionaceae bacterium]
MHKCKSLSFTKQTAGALCLGACLALSGCAVSSSSLVEMSPSAQSNPEQTEDLYTLESVKNARYLTGTLRPQAQRLHSWKDLEPSLNDTLTSIAARDSQATAIADGSVSVTWGDVSRTLHRLKDLLPSLDSHPELLAEQFRWLRLSKKAFFTGYYNPVLLASRTRRPGFSYPIYRRPPDLQDIRLDAFAGMPQKRLRYRTSSNGPVPYHTRSEIDAFLRSTENGRGALEGRRLELLWLRDCVDGYFLHLEGSGYIRFEEDGREYLVRYAGVNGKRYSSVGQTLADMGELDRDELSLQSVRSWLRNNLDRAPEVLFRDESYVFFHMEETTDNTETRLGAANLPLKPFVSFAVDPQVIPLGMPLIFDLDAAQPEAQDGPPLRGIGFAHDTGGVIRENRLDMFCGRGPEAETVSGSLQRNGYVWILLAI